MIQELRRQTAAITGLNVFLTRPKIFRLAPARARAYISTPCRPAISTTVPLCTAGRRRNPQAARLAGHSSDLQIKSPQTVLNIDRQKAAALGLTPSRFVQRALRLVRHAPGRDDLHRQQRLAVILELDPCQQNPRPFQGICSFERRSSSCRSSTVATLTQGAGPLTVNHQGQLPAVTISFNSRRASPSARRSTASRKWSGGWFPADHHGRLFGNGAGVSAVAARPGLAAAGDRSRHLHRAGHPLRELYPPDHNSFGAAGGRRRCAADPDAVQDGPSASLRLSASSCWSASSKRMRS